MPKTPFLDLIESLPRAGGALLIPSAGGVVAEEAADLDGRSRDLAAALSEYGLAPGDRAAIVSRDIGDVLLGFLAILRAGGVPVLLDPGLPPGDLLDALRSAEARQVLVEDERCLAVVLGLRPDLPSLDLAMLYRASPGVLAAAITVADAWAAGARFRSEEDGESEPPALAERDAEPVALRFARSAGTLRSSSLTGAAVATGARAFVDCLGLAPGETVAAALPVWDPAVLVLALACLGRGARISLLPSGGDPAEILGALRPEILLMESDRLKALRDRLLRAMRAEALVAGALLRLALAEGRRRGAPDLAAGRLPSARPWRWRLADALVLGRVRAIAGGRMRALVPLGPPSDPSVISFFLDAGFPLLEGASAPEACGLVAVNRPAAVRPGTAGKPVPGLTVRTRADGRLEVEGPMVSGPGWVASELSGRLDADGYLVLDPRS